MNIPIVSVAMIVYNQEEYIAEAINSIIKQEHSFSYEIVIGDDCSSDNTRAILADFQNKYPDVIKLLLNDENMGLINNYFNVLNHCSGKYIMECAGDDYWLPGKIALQVPYLEENTDCGLVYTKARQYSHDKQKMMKQYWGRPLDGFNDLIYIQNDIPSLTVCFRRDLLIKYLEEIKPETRFWKSEDYPMWLWFSLNSKIDFIDMFSAVYRIVKESETHSSDLKKREDYCYSDHDIRVFFLKYFNIAYDELQMVNKLYNSLAYMSLYAKKRKGTLYYFKRIKSSDIRQRIKIMMCRSRILFNMYYLIIKTKSVL